MLTAFSGSPYITFRIAGSSLPVKAFLAAASGAPLHGSVGLPAEASLLQSRGLRRHRQRQCMGSGAATPPPGPRAQAHSWGTSGQLPGGTVDLPNGGIEPVSALVDSKPPNLGSPHKRIIKSHTVDWKP